MLLGIDLPQGPRAVCVLNLNPCTQPQARWGCVHGARATVDFRISRKKSRGRVLASMKASLARPDLDCIREESPFCQTFFIARLSVELVWHCLRGVQRSGLKARENATALPPSFCDARQTFAVRASYTFMKSLQSSLPHVSRRARENNLHATTLSPTLARSLVHSLALSLATALLPHVADAVARTTCRGISNTRSPNPPLACPRALAVGLLQARRGVRVRSRGHFAHTEVLPLPDPPAGLSNPGTLQQAYLTLGPSSRPIYGPAMVLGGGPF